jgi:hypothetical protein
MFPNDPPPGEQFVNTIKQTQSSTIMSCPELFKERLLDKKSLSEQIQVVRDELRKLDLSQDVMPVEDFGYRHNLYMIQVIQKEFFDKHVGNENPELTVLRNEFQEQVATFMRVNERWDRVFRALDNPESFLEGETLYDMYPRENWRYYSHKPKMFYEVEKGRWYVNVSSLHDVLNLADDFFTPCLKIYELLSERAMDVLVALGHVNCQKRTSSTQRYIRLYEGDVESGESCFLLGENMHALFAPTTSPSFVERFYFL